MIKSMTGYGRGDCTLHNRRFTVEIKSVNHRYNDISIKLPKVMNPFEDRIRKTVAERITRGKTDIYVSYESTSSDDIKLKLNAALADAYAEQLGLIKERYSLDDGISLSLIAKFPDLISVEKNAADEEIAGQMWEALSAALEIALEQFVAMREREGAALKDDMLLKNADIAAICLKIKERAPDVADDYRQKMLIRVREAIEKTIGFPSSGGSAQTPRFNGVPEGRGGFTEIDEQRILTEIVIFADKSCIDEELTRLDSHLEQFARILNESDPVGKKLDFLVQEMNREVNTIGSKSNDIVITRLVVDLKSEIEKIREQVQNIE